MIDKNELKPGVKLSPQSLIAAVEMIRPFANAGNCKKVFELLVGHFRTLQDDNEFWERQALMIAEDYAELRKQLMAPIGEGILISRTELNFHQQLADRDNDFIAQELLAHIKAMINIQKISPAATALVYALERLDLFYYIHKRKNHRGDTMQGCNRCTDFAQAIYATKRKAGMIE